jgi:2-(1,2-epoxy-1,2-dihydrophenyl)acetyl-CoA isomerase
MKTISIEFEDETVKTYLNDSLAILEIKKDAFSMMTQVNEGFKLINWFDTINSDDTIKGVLLLGSPDLFCNAPYEKFLSSISKEDLTNSHFHNLKSIDVDMRKKQINMLNNLTRLMLKFPKMIITFFNGCIVTPFIGLTLAADVKLATNQSSFSFLHKKYGLHPSGALPFFLNASLGISKTKQILYTKDELNSKELLELGLIDEIIISSDTENIIEYSKRIVENNSKTFASTKQLINVILHDQYSSFMKLEEQMVF